MPWVTLVTLNVKLLSLRSVMPMSEELSITVSPSDTVRVASWIVGAVFATMTAG